MKTNHTPGPWQVAETQHHGQTLDIVESSTARILARTFINSPFPEQAANARLIASSPDLLAALQFLLAEYNQHIPEGIDCPKIMEAARQAETAIQKATEPA